MEFHDFQIRAWAVDKKLASVLMSLDPEDELRIRLRLDAALLNLPWEYVILPDAAGLKTPGGFLVLDARVSLVREPPKPGRKCNSGSWAFVETSKILDKKVKKTVGKRMVKPLK